MAHFSKQLDHVASGLPGCLRGVSGTPLLVDETNKLTFGQCLEVLTSQQVQGLLEVKRNNGCLLKYQSLLLETPDVTLKICQNLNPATYLSESTSTLDHYCIQAMEQVHSTEPDLKDWPLDNPKVE